MYAQGLMVQRTLIQRVKMLLLTVNIKINNYKYIYKSENDSSDVFFLPSPFVNSGKTTPALKGRSLEKRIYIYI